MTRHPADPAATLATLIALTQSRPFNGFTDDNADEPDPDYPTDRDADLAAGWHYLEGP